MATSYELLDAVNTKDVRTTAHVAVALRVNELEARRQLHAAVREGLICEEQDESVNVPRDFDRQVWRLTEKGYAEWDRVDEERSST